jgi:hypothetical protein
MTPDLIVLLSCLASAGACTLYVSSYARKQNSSKAMGGPISPAKSYWLGFAVFAWFFLPFCLIVPGMHGRAVEIMLGTYATSMWVRGISELLLLYKWKLWRPPMGIGHDFFCQAVLLAQAFYFREELLASTGRDLVLALLCLWLFVSLIFEIYYAWAFYGAVNKGTTGEGGIWFADDDPRFKRILRVTRIGNVTLTISLVSLLGAYFALD